VTVCIGFHSGGAPLARFGYGQEAYGITVDTLRPDLANRPIFKPGEGQDP
jgi:hypothetical protein